MGVPELRQELHDYINHADERFLKMVHAMSVEYNEPAPIGYETDGTEIDRDEFSERIRAASKRVKSGDYISQDDIEKEVENW